MGTSLVRPGKRRGHGPASRPRVTSVASDSYTIGVLIERRSRARCRRRPARPRLRPRGVRVGPHRAPRGRPRGRASPEPRGGPRGQGPAGARAARLRDDLVGRDPLGAGVEQGRPVALHDRPRRPDGRRRHEEPGGRRAGGDRALREGAGRPHRPASGPRAGAEVAGAPDRRPAPADARGPRRRPRRQRHGRAVVRRALEPPLRLGRQAHREQRAVVHRAGRARRPPDAGRPARSGRRHGRRTGRASRRSCAPRSTRSATAACPGSTCTTSGRSWSGGSCRRACGSRRRSTAC